MKKIIWFVVLIIIVVVVYSAVTKNTEEDIIEEDAMEQAEAMEAMDSIQAPEGASLMDAQNSTFSWEGKKTVLADWIDTGTIELDSGYIVFDEEGNPVSGEALIDMSTIQALTIKGEDNEEGREGLTTHLKSDDWFGVEEYPTSKMVVSSFTAVEDQENVYTADAELTIRGTTNPITFDLTQTSEGTLTGQMQVDRSEYDVKFGSGKFFSDLGDGLLDDIFTLDFVIVLQ